MTIPYKYIFGPVYSWRLGRSLGVDPVTTKHKICNLDCIYCQLGRTQELVQQRAVFIDTKAMIDEIAQVPLDCADHITFSGRGEPTLALNLGDMIKAVKNIRPEKVAVITNSVLMPDPVVRQDLMAADIVVAKLDGSNQDDFDAVDQGEGVDFEIMINGLISFRSQYKGKLALQVMFVEENIKHASKIAEVVRQIHPNEVHLDTPLRPSAVKPLSRQQLMSVEKFFHPMLVKTVFDAPIKDFTPIDERATISRHGNWRKTS